MKTHHVCYEGTLACSGCNPCAHCLDVVNREVLAQAMRRTTEVIAQARGVHGVVAVKELDTQNFWAVFYGFYGEAWRALHVAMMQDPKVAERAYDLRAIPGFESTGRYVPPVLPAPVAAPVPVAAPGAAAIPSVVAPLHAPLPSSVVPLSALALQAPSSAHVPPGAEPPTAPSTPWVASYSLRDDAAAPAVVPAVAENSSPAAPSAPDVEPKLAASSSPSDIRRPITAEDIAASATVLEAAPPPPAPSSANGARSTSG